MVAESRFKRMLIISLRPSSHAPNSTLRLATDFAAVFESDDAVAHARYTCFATHGRSEQYISEYFMGGVAGCMDRHDEG